MLVLKTRRCFLSAFRYFECEGFSSFLGGGDFVVSVLFLEEWATESVETNKMKGGG